MGTTIESGANFSTVTTSKLRFTKGPGEVTEGSGTAVTDSVTLNSPSQSAPTPAPNAYQPTRFRDLDGATRAEYKDTVKDLASSGRLYVRDEKQATLRRADPMEIKERLDKGQPVELVTRVASESYASGSHNSYDYNKQRGAFTHGYNIANSSSSARSSERVFYTTSPVTEWESLDFATAGQGVKGVAILPASGGSVEVSNSFESQWSRRASEQWGFFTEKNRDEQAGAFTRVSHTAD